MLKSSRLFEAVADTVREIVLDTETTGLDPKEGHRIVEIGCVELVNHVPTGVTWHRYINPLRDMPDDALAVHGLTAAFLADKPLFAEVAPELMAFIGDARLVMHNGAFDMMFLNAELGACGFPPLPAERLLDTLDIARRKYPNAPNSLDALCRRFAVDATARTKHGALIDCDLLAAVYLELVGGRQPGFALMQQVEAHIEIQIERPLRPARPHAPSAEELAAHRRLIAGMENAVWLQ